MSLALSVRNLSVRYAGNPAVPAVNGVDLELQNGEVVGLVGESGCGKSSIAGAILGILDESVISAEHIRLGGHELSGLSERQYRPIRGRDVSMVFQEPQTALDPVFTIGSQLGAVLRRHGMANRKNVRARSHEALLGMNFGDIPTLLRSYPHQLSGGMRQRIMIAMAMACRPAVLLADEPTTALDVTTQAQVLRSLLNAGKENNTAILLITHDLAVATSICERIIVMRAGRFVETAETAALLSHPEHPYTACLLEADPGSGKRNDRTSPTPGDTIIALEKHKVSHPIRVNGRRKRLVAVNEVDLEIRRGEILALVGESGSGKSTLAHSLLGLKPSHSDSIRYFGDLIKGSKRESWSRIRRHVQLVFQDPRASLSPRRTVGQSLVEPLNHFGIDDPGNRPARVAEALEQVDLDASVAARLPGELSGGQRQRVALARALISEPDVVVADEPLSSLDVSVQAKVIELLLRLRHELGFAILIVSHDLAVVRQLADRIAVMYLGRIVETAPAKQLFDNPAHPYTQALLSAVPTPGQPFETGALNMAQNIGEAPSLLTPPPGCVFHTRCPKAMDRCKRITPPEQRLNIISNNHNLHSVNCLLYED